MRIALISDIHGNLEALAAVLTHAMRQRVDRIAVLGDIVGYGADPRACTEAVMRLAEEGAIVLKGNHDEAVERADPDMNADALAAITWTRGVLSADHRAFLAGLPLTARLDDLLLVHASARHPGQWPYVMTPRDAELSLDATDARLVASGHTHVPALFSLQPNRTCVAFTPVAGSPVPLAAHRRWQIVVGAVGQPRDGTPLAAYAVLDLAQGVLEPHRVPYDHQAAAAKIRAAGLPDRLASRLALGR
ncbi:metallophosphoesterase family protein [Phreatobacter oligotrophus]|uniref:metallophosphoesterase family protein n=1 Tax=Phreatobacter oligotrophus TaxID=1122261 RepID=UPI0023523AFB|nr:metallophosphoesterase family protein [Phreatobacter oligotrophus]MBX9991193.1 metallophosphatase family protein [Phreatobacter oligotrophus]